MTTFSSFSTDKYSNRRLAFQWVLTVFLCIVLGHQKIILLKITLMVNFLQTPGLILGFWELCFFLDFGSSDVALFDGLGDGLMIFDIWTLVLHIYCSVIKRAQYIQTNYSRPMFLPNYT